MQTRLRLWHTWQEQLHQLLPGVRRTRTANLALFVLGLLWAGSVTLSRVAASLPLVATDLSRQRRLRRWLANSAVDVRDLWAQMLPAVLADLSGEVLLVFDPTPQNNLASILVLGLLQHKRVLPVAWRVVAQQTPWPESQLSYLTAMMAEVAAALPPQCEVTLLVDRGITSPDVLDLCQHLGWHYVFRVSVSAHTANRVQEPGAAERRLWELVTRPGQRWTGTVQLFKDAGWRSVELTIHWARAAAEPWVLCSDRPAGPARVREYRRRMRVEATYEDCKTRGFQIEHSKLQQTERLDRLLLALHLALWWGQQLGLRVIRQGQRRRFDRTDRRDLSVLRLGRRALADLLCHDRCPPLPFRWQHDQWHFTWFT